MNNLLLLQLGIIYLGGILLLIWACVPPREPRNPRKGQVTLIPDKYIDPWGHNSRKRGIR